MKSLFVVLALMCMSLTGPASASGGGERKPAHFKAESSATLEQAVTNLRTYNARLERILAGPVSDADMVEVHQLTYTLETALKKIDEEVEQLAETLEKVHVGSEKLDRDVVVNNGRAYLDTAAKLVR